MDVIFLITSGIVVADSVHFHLNRSYLISRRTKAEWRAGVAFGIGGYRSVADDIYIVAVIILQYLIRGHSAVGKSYRSPLRQSLAGYAGAVAELGEKRFHTALSYNIVVEYLINNIADVIKTIPPSIKSSLPTEYTAKAQLKR